MALSSHQVIDLTNEENGVDVWRKQINPFQAYHILDESKFSFESEKLYNHSRKIEKNDTLKNNNDDLMNKKEYKEAEEQLNPVESNNNQSYHLEFLTCIIDNVKSLKSFNILFDNSERRILETFQTLSEGCQDLYIRLFQRKRNWIKEGKIQYNGIDCPLSLSSLSKKGFTYIIFNNPSAS